MITTLMVVRYCAEEVSRQMDGPLEVEFMVDAYTFAQERQANGQKLSIELIREIGIKVEPWTNREGFRRHDISVGANQIGVGPYEIRTKLGRLCRAINGEDCFEYELPLVWRTDVKVKTSFKTIDRQAPVASLDDNLNSLEFSYANVPAVLAYYNFEKIHPFGDGNGRTGKIILNWINKSLDAPIMPPNLFGCSNP